MALSRQQSSLLTETISHFLVPEPLGRRMQVHFARAWVADSENVVPLSTPLRAGTDCGSAWPQSWAHGRRTPMAPNTLPG